MKSFIVLKYAIIILHLYSVQAHSSTCKPIPDMYGQLIVDQCIFHTIGKDFGGRNEIAFEKKDWGITLKGTFTKKTVIFERPKSMVPRRAYHFSQPSGNKSESWQVRNPMTMAYVTNNRNICEKFPPGKIVYLNVYFMCHGSGRASAKPPWGYGTSFLSTEISDVPIAKYKK